MCIVVLFYTLLSLFIGDQSIIMTVKTIKTKPKKRIRMRNERKKETKSEWKNLIKSFPICYFLNSVAYIYLWIGILSMLRNNLFTILFNWSLFYILLFFFAFMFCIFFSLVSFFLKKRSSNTKQQSTIQKLFSTCIALLSWLPIEFWKKHNAIKQK